MVQWVRPIVTLISIVGINAGFFLDKISAEAYIGVVAMSIAWWFKARDEAKNK